MAEPSPQVGLDLRSRLPPAIRPTIRTGGDIFLIILNCVKKILERRHASCLALPCEMLHFSEKKPVQGIVVGESVSASKTCTPYEVN